MKRKKNSTPDFPKKKQKLGKGKRPPDNATNISFKSQSVVLPVQLKETSGPTTHRNLTLQELLKHLVHPKPSIRRDALTGLRELFTVHPASLLSSLSQLIKQFSVIFVDQEDGVRHAFYLLLKHVFQTVNAKQIAPFFPLLIASLKCGLTHINYKIQIDGMKITDLIISNYPLLIKESANDLLPLYLPLIARRTQNSVSPGIKKSGKDGGRSAVLLSLYNSRLQILKQLLKFLQLIGFSDQPKRHDNLSPLIDVEKELAWPNGDVLSEPQQLEEYLTTSTFLLSLRSDPLKFKSHSHSTKISHHALTSQSALYETGFINQFVQVLLECWVEIVSGPLLQDSSHSMKMTSKNSTLVELLYTILQLFSLLVRISRMNGSDETGFISPKFLTQINTHFMTYFPLLEESGSQRPPPMVLMMNLQMCQLLSAIFTSSSSSSSGNVSPITDYVTSRLPLCSSLLSHTGLTNCVSIITDILQDFAKTQLTFSSEVTQSLYRSCSRLFFQCHSLSLAKQHFLSFIDHTMDSFIIAPKGMSQSFLTLFLHPCLSSLPDLLSKLVKPVDQVKIKLILKILKQAMVCQIDCVLKSFHTKLPQIYSTNGFLSFIPQSLQPSLLYLLGHLPLLTKSDLVLFSNLITSGELHEPTITSLVFILHNKLLDLTENTQNSSPGDYPALVANHVSFLVSTLIGYSEDQLKKIQAEDTLSNSSGYIVLVHPLIKCDVDEKRRVSEVIVCCLLGTHLPSHQLLTLLEPLINQLLLSNMSLPCDVVYAILHLLHMILKEGCGLMPSSPLSQTLPSLLLTTLVSKETNVPQHPLVENTYQLTNQIIAIDKLVFNDVLQLISHSTQWNGRILTNVFLRLINESSIDAAICNHGNQSVFSTTKNLILLTQILFEHVADHCQPRLTSQCYNFISILTDKDSFLKQQLQAILTK